MAPSVVLMTAATSEPVAAAMSTNSAVRNTTLTVIAVDPNPMTKLSVSPLASVNGPVLVVAMPAGLVAEQGNEGGPWSKSPRCTPLASVAASRFDGAEHPRSEQSSTRSARSARAARRASPRDASVRVGGRVID